MNTTTFAYDEIQNEKKESPFLSHSISAAEKRTFMTTYHQYVSDYGESFDDALRGLFLYAILLVIWEWSSSVKKIGNILPNPDKRGKFLVTVETDKGIRNIIFSLHTFDMLGSDMTEEGMFLWVYYQEISEDGEEYEDDIAIDEVKLRSWSIIQNTVHQYEKSLLTNTLN